MSDQYFKYKALSLTPKGELDDRSMKQVVEPVIESYYYLPTREKLNNPNEGIFQNQIQAGITAFLQGVVGIGERTEIAESLYNLARQIGQSTDNSGVFSLSKNVTDELMWAHYGASHCGLVIEYNLDQLTRFCSRQHLHCFGVEYVEEPPNLDMQSLQGHAGEAVRAMLGHKSPRWSYEEEFRIVLENMHGSLPHDYRAVKSITFGLKVPEKARKNIFEATKHKVPEYYEIRKVPETYILERRPLEEFLGESPTGEPSSIDWSRHFQKLNGNEKEHMVSIAQCEIENDPHFEELVLAEKSPTSPSKVVLQCQAKHHLGLEPWTKYTKHYYEL
tara:strand:- start:3065 stop:4060 length:996 start_codon:yes stop_codon:yes gene_type:complete